jgi:hypothetical protein
LQADTEVLDPVDGAHADVDAFELLDPDPR